MPPCNVLYIHYLEEVDFAPAWEAGVGTVGLVVPYHPPYYAGLLAGLESQGVGVGVEAPPAWRQPVRRGLAEVMLDRGEVRWWRSQVELMGAWVVVQEVVVVSSWVVVVPVQLAFQSSFHPLLPAQEEPAPSLNSHVSWVRILALL